MVKVIAYQLGLILALLAAWALSQTGRLPHWLQTYETAFNCMLVSTLAGILYCLRAVYLNRSVENRWEVQWEVWYYLRPLASAIAGLVSFVFLKASIIVLEASQPDDVGNYGFLAFSFIAGYNVDKFLKKIEGLASSSFGVDKSRAYRKSNDDN
jgi:hypothetical protein